MTRWAHTPQERRELLEEARATGRKVTVRRIRTPGNDCMNKCVAALLGIPYEDTPPAVADPAERDSNWKAWAPERKLRWWTSLEWAPVFLDRWIASVDALSGSRNGHAVLMCRDQLYYDPNEDGDSPSYVAVRPSDIRRAHSLLPADTPSLGGRFWRITNPAPRRVLLASPERTPDARP